MERLEEKLVIPKAQKNADECAGKNKIYDLTLGRNLCQLRKGKPQFQCIYLESNPVEIKHYCRYNK